MRTIFVHSFSTVLLSFFGSLVVRLVLKKTKCMDVRSTLEE